MRWRALVVCAWSLAPTAALAQDQAPVLNAGQPYQGVIPGTPNPPPRLRVARGNRRVVTWPGFQVSGEGTRIFVQTSQPVTAHESRGQSRLVYRLPGCVISTRNNRNPLVTAHFNTPVTTAYLRSAGRDVELVIELRAPVSPIVVNAPGENGFQFIFIEFPAGNYLPEGPPPVTDPRVRVRSSGSRSRSTGSSPEPSPNPGGSMGPTP